MKPEHPGSALLMGSPHRISMTHSIHQAHAISPYLPFGLLSCNRDSNSDVCARGWLRAPHQQEGAADPHTLLHAAARLPAWPRLLAACRALQCLFVGFKQWPWPALFSLPLPRFPLLYRAGAFFFSFFFFLKSMGSDSIVLKVTFQIPARDRSPQIVLSTPAEHESLFISV